MEQQASPHGMAPGNGPGLSAGTPQYQNNTAAFHQASASAQFPQPAPLALHPPATAVHPFHVLASGLFGLVVVGTGTLGASLHKVNQGDMSMSEALSHSLSTGAVGGIATAAATAASSALTRGGLPGLAVTLATATGVSYLLSKS